MSQYNNKGMASDLSLGRSSPSAGAGTDSNTAAIAARHAAYLMQQVSAARDQQLESQDDAEYERTLTDGLQCYVRALQGEREKLDAFRRELPICMGLLDDAIHAAREKLTKAVASSRTVACEASYSNYGNPAYAAHTVSKGGVHSTPSRERDASMYTWRGFSGSCKEHDVHAAHASDDDDHQFEKQAQVAASFKESPFTMMGTGHPTAPSHLHLINYPPPPHTTSINPMLLNNKFQQKEGTVFNEGTHEMIRPQATVIKPEGFQNTLDFSSSRMNEDDQHTMLQRDASNGYAGGPVQYIEHVHNQEEAATSPTLMMTSCSTGNLNGMTSSINGMPATPQTPRKARRCWSPELHQRFLHALHQLGGPQSATPKQIREVMHVEGLTNDEVKSHLQKFRLHTRRPAPIQASEPAQQPHHLVLFGGIWVPTSPAESTPAAQLAACQLAGGGHATSSGSQNPYMHVIGHNPMQALMRGAPSDPLDMHGGLETASEVDVARSEQSTSQNGGVDNNMHEDEDTEIHLGSKPREITSPIAKARYQ